jgi:hypothetical protein
MYIILIFYTIFNNLHKQLNFLTDTWKLVRCEEQTLNYCNVLMNSGSKRKEYDFTHVFPIINRRGAP